MASKYIIDRDEELSDFYDWLQEEVNPEDPIPTDLNWRVHRLLKDFDDRLQLIEKRTPLIGEPIRMLREQ